MWIKLNIRMQSSVIILAVITTIVCNAMQIHHDMTEDEIRRLFHVEKHYQVPEYEVVGIRSTEGDSKGLQKVQVRAFGKDLSLNLVQRATQSTGPPLYEASANATGHTVYTLIHHKEHIGDTYQDPDNEAAILIHRGKDGQLLMEGTIGHDLVLRPIPWTVKQRLELDSKDEESKGHVIYRRNSKDPDHLSDYAFMEPDGIPRKRTKRSSRSKREAPYVIYPEILVIVDYDGYRLHGGDNVQIKRYFVSFWNGVDLRYKLLKGPKVRISIAGIIISRGRDATPYLERNRVGRDAIDSAAALTDMGKYLFRERRLPVYDIAVAITKLDMCRRSHPGDGCNRGTAGFAYVGGACVVNKRLEKVNSVAIIEDTGGFSGIIVAAHEVGHLLGAVHDGSTSPSYLGGPGAEKCRWEDGFIMSDLRHTEKGFRWSPCSVASFHHFLNGETATCLYNSPHEDESLPRVLPGKLLSLDAQCRRDRGTSACFKDERVCAQLFCFDAGSGYCVAYRPAAEGSPCGDSQYCSNGRCIAENENLIPDYSQQTATYLRRTDPATSATQSRPVFTSSPLNSTRRLWSSESTTQTSYKVPALASSSVTTNGYRHFTQGLSSLVTGSFRGKSTSVAGIDRDSASCVDRPRSENGVSCYEFVTRWGKQYCDTQYIRKHCCAAHRYLCPQTLRLT